MIAKLRLTVSRLHQIPRALHLVWEATGRWSILWMLLLLLQSLIPALIVHLSRSLVDAIAFVLNDGGNNGLQGVIFSAATIGALMLINLLMDNWLEWINVLKAELVGDHLAGLIHHKSANVDLAFYEMPEFHDHLERARDDAFHLPLHLLESIGEMIKNFITLAAMSLLLLPYGLWMPLALVLSTIPAFLALIRYHQELHRWWEAAITQKRWASYYDNMLTMDSTASEIRLLDLGPFFINAFQKVRASLREEELRITRNHSWVQLGAGLVALCVSAATAIWVLRRAAMGLYSLGDLALMYQAFDRGQSLLRSLLGNVGLMYRHILFISNLFEYLDLEQTIASPPNPLPVPQPLRQGICFDDVTFYYPGNRQAALENFNIDIPAGKTVAIVGENGAGKSTLVKLLCRFYDPQSGSIKVDGIDLRQMRVDTWRKTISVMFQQPVPYHATAAQNIAVGNRIHHYSQKQIEQAAQAAGAHDLITKLPNGYETMLGKWFVDGTGLSGGEWQRVALARAFLEPTDILILDEPTSAMDPWTEAGWLERVQQLLKERSALIITHRFTTAMLADLIYVMHAGKIVESGSHRELLVTDGTYAQYWHTHKPKEFGNRLASS